MGEVCFFKETDRPLAAYYAKVNHYSYVHHDQRRLVTFGGICKIATVVMNVDSNIKIAQTQSTALTDAQYTLTNRSFGNIYTIGRAYSHIV